MLKSSSFFLLCFLTIILRNVDVLRSYDDDKPYDVLVSGAGLDAAHVVHQLQRHLLDVAFVEGERANLIQRVVGNWRCGTGKEGTV